MTQTTIPERLDYLGDPPLMSRQARRATLLTRRHITTVLDVGANEGQYAASLREHGYRGRIVSFEPLDGPFQTLAARAAQDPLWECRNVALGTDEGEHEMNVARDPRASSLLPWDDRWTRTPAERHFVATERIRVTRLDAVWTEVVSPEERVWLKVDTEGYEHRVLEGAPAESTELAVLEVELSLVPLWRGELRFPAMVEYLAGRGFLPVAFEGLTEDPASGVMKQVDGIFLHSSQQP